MTAEQIQTSQTPILDRLTPLPVPAKPRRISRSVSTRIWIIGLGILAILVLMWPPFVLSILNWLAKTNEKIDAYILTLSADDPVGLRLLFLMIQSGILIALAGAAAVVLHECGHLLAGLSVGFRFRRVRIWKLQIDSSWRVSWCLLNKYDPLGETRFFADSMCSRPLKAAVMVFAGPLANLISGSALLILPIHKSLISRSFIAISFILVLVNLIPPPAAEGGIHSDGYLLLTLLRRRAKYERSPYSKLWTAGKRGLKLSRFHPISLPQRQL